MFCKEAIRLSRPNRAVNHGSPAAGPNAKPAVPSVGSRTAAQSSPPGRQLGEHSAVEVRMLSTPSFHCGAAAASAATLAPHWSGAA